MNIGQASSHSGLSPKTIRYYESVGLVVPQRQADNRYRIYSAENVRDLRFLHLARQAGFGLNQSRELLELYRSDPRGLSADQQSLLLEHVQWLEAQREILTHMRDLLLGVAQGENTGEPRAPAPPENPAQIQTHGMSFTLLESKP